MKRLYFLDGEIVFANSDVEEDRLGRFLIRSGVIDEQAYERASSSMQTSGRRLGKSLIALGNVNDEELDELINEQVREIIYSVFNWDCGHYAFESLDRPVEDDIVVDLSTGAVILEGVRRMSMTPAIQSWIGDAHRIPHPMTTSSLLDGAMALTSSEGFVLSRVDGSTSVEELAAISPLGEDETFRCVYGLLSTGILKLEEPKSRATSRTRAVTPPPQVESPPAEPEGPSVEDQAILDDIVKKHASLETATHYELLEVPRWANAEEIKKAYYAFAKKYHPDRRAADVFQSVHEKLEELLMRGATSYELLSDPAARARYERTLPPIKAPEPPPAAPVPTRERRPRAAENEAEEEKNSYPGDRLPESSGGSSVPVRPAPTSKIGTITKRSKNYAKPPSSCPMSPNTTSSSRKCSARILTGASRRSFTSAKLSSSLLSTRNRTWASPTSTTRAVLRRGPRNSTRQFSSSTPATHALSQSYMEIGARKARS